MQEENSWFDKNNLRILTLFVLAFFFIYLDNTDQKYFKKTKSFINDGVSHASYIVTWPIRELLASPGYIRSIIILKEEKKHFQVFVNSDGVITFHHTVSPHIGLTNVIMCH